MRESRGGKERVLDGEKRLKVGDGRESKCEREIKSRGWGRESKRWLTEWERKSEREEDGSSCV